MSGQYLRRGSVSAVLVALVVVATPDAQQPATPNRFRYERVIVTAPGPQRLAVDLPLLVGAEPFRVVPGLPTNGSDLAPPPFARDGLADLRLFDAGGAAVPHLLISLPRVYPPWTAANVLPIARTEKTSGFEADLGSVETVNALEVAGIPSPFLKRMTLEGSGDREHWTILIADGTMFDLPDESLSQTFLTFPAGPYRYLRVTWDDRNSARVRPPSTARVRGLSGAGPPPMLSAPLAFERRPSEPGVSRFRVKLPAARLPITEIELDVRAGHVFRNAGVYESRLSGAEAAPAELGRWILRRVEREGLAAGSMRIPIRLAPLGSEIEIVVDDESNPPLELSGVAAVFADLPWIYFEAPAGPIVARYGSPSATAPVYDLEAVRQSVDIAAVPDAKWGEPRQLARVESSAAASPMPDRGAAIDIGGFSYRRALPDGGAGLVALALDPAALSHTRGPSSRFADARIVDASGRQVPYLVERRNEPLPVTLSLQPVPSVPADLRSSPSHSRSTYRLQFPSANLPGGRIALETSGRTFQRAVQLSVERPADRRRRDPWVEVIAAGTWSHREQDSAAPALVLPLPAIDRTDVLLTLDEGDNSPLPITSVTLLLPSYRLRFYRPESARLSLVYGSRDVAPPQYDLSLLAPQVMGAEAREIAPGPEVESSGAAAARAALVPTWMFWTLLAGAIVVLLALIARLVTQKT